jgi:hypothetical protein
MSDSDRHRVKQHDPTQVECHNLYHKKQYARDVSLGFSGLLYAYCHSRDGCIGSVTGVGGFPTGCHEQLSTRQPYPVFATLSSKKAFFFPLYHRRVRGIR